MSRHLRPLLLVTIACASVAASGLRAQTAEEIAGMLTAGKFQEAEAALRPLLEERDVEEPILRLGLQCYARQGKSFSAQRVANRLLQVNPNPDPNVLYAAAHAAHQAAAFETALTRYRQYLGNAPKNHPERQGALIKLLNVQCYGLDNPATGRDALLLYLKDYGYDKDVAVYTWRILDALGRQANSGYHETVATLLAKAPESEHGDLVMHYLQAARLGGARYQREPWQQIAEFLVENKVTDPRHAEPILRALVIEVDAGNPTATVRAERLSAARNYAQSLTNVLPPQEWPSALMALSLQACLAANDVQWKTEGLRRYNRLSTKVLAQKDEALDRRYLRALTMDYQLEPMAGIIEGLHDFVEALGVENCKDELYALHLLRQKFARLKPQAELKDTDKARAELLQAIKLWPNPNTVRFYLNAFPEANVDEALKAAGNASATDRLAMLQAAATALKERSKHAEIGAMVSRAADLSPYSFLNGKQLLDAYARNVEVPDDQKVTTLTQLYQRYPSSPDVQKLLEESLKSFAANGKTAPAETLEKLRIASLEPPADNPWSEYPAFARAAKDKNVETYAKLLQAFGAKHKPSSLPRGGDSLADAMWQHLTQVLPAAEGMNSKQIAEALLPAAEYGWPGPLVGQLTQAKDWENVVAVGRRAVAENVLKHGKAWPAVDQERIEEDLLKDRFYAAVANRRDYDALVETMVPLLSSKLVSNEFRHRQVVRCLEVLRPDQEARTKFLSRTVQTMPDASLKVSPDLAEAVAEAYHDSRARRSQADPKVVAALAKMYEVSGCTDAAWERMHAKIATADNGPVRDAWMQKALAEVPRANPERKRQLLDQIFEAAQHEGWRRIADGHRNQIVMDLFLPAEQEWLAQTLRPNQTFVNPGRKPWVHFWALYENYATKKADEQPRFEAKMAELSQLLVDRLPTVRDAHLNIAKQGLLHADQLDSRQQATDLARLVGLSLRSQMDGQYLKEAVAALNERNLPEVAGTLARVVLKANDNVPPEVRKIAQVMVSELSKTLGIYEIPVSPDDPAYDLYAGEQAFVFGDRGRAQQLLLGRSNLLPTTWRELDPDYVVFGIDALRMTGQMQEAENLINTILLEEQKLPAEFLAGVYRAKADLARDQEKYELAIVEYKSLLADKKLAQTRGGRQAQFNLVDTYRITRNFGEAKVLLDRLANSGDYETQARAYYFHALIAHDQDQIDQAYDFLAEVFKRKATDNDASLLKGRLDLKRGEYYKAVDLEIGLIAEQKTVVPFKPVKLKIADPNLGIARGGDAIPVLVTTSSGQDREIVKLRAKEGNRSVFEGEISTKLGVPKPNTLSLELSGKDKVLYTIDPEFQKAQGLFFPVHELNVVSDAQLVASSGEIISEDERKRRELEEELRRRQDQDDVMKSTLNRDASTIRPGNFIYVQVQDFDRDLSDEADTVPVRVMTTSGDVIEAFPLTETEPHSGIFQGKVKTGTPLPKASASDSQEGSDPNVVINRQKADTWQSVADGQRDKWFEVDLQTPRKLSELHLNSAGSEITQMELWGAAGIDDYRLLAQFPDPATAPTALHFQGLVGEVGMSPRQVRLALVADRTLHGPIKSPSFAREYVPQLGGEEDVLVQIHGHFFIDERQTVNFQGQTESGEARAWVYLDGELVTEDAAESFRKTLAPGVHELEILLAGYGPDLLWRLTTMDAEGNWQPMPLSWFDLAKHPELQKAVAPKASISRVEQRLVMGLQSGQRYRKLRFVFNRFKGNAVALSEVKVLDHERKQLLPSDSDFTDAMKNDTLELSAGDDITVMYEDRIRVREETPVLSATLSSSFFDAEIAMAHEVMNERREANYFPVKRVRVGDMVVVRVEDWDRDVSDQRDAVEVTIKSSRNDDLQLQALESEPHSGVFLATLKFGEEMGPDTVRLVDGAKIEAVYFDSENTDPGTGIDRKHSIFEAGGDAPEIIVLETATRMESVVEERSGSATRRGEEERAVLEKQIIATFQPHLAAAEAAKTSIDAPVLFFVRQPSAALNDLSTVKGHIYSASAKAAAEAGGPPLEKLEVQLQIESLDGLAKRKGFNNVRLMSLPDNEQLLERGLFAGICKLQLGKPGDTVNNLVITPEAAFGTVGERERPSRGDETTVPTIIVQGRDTVFIEIPHGGDVVTKTVELYCDGEVHFLDRDFEAVKEGFYLGEPLYVRVVDLDLDASDDYDTMQVQLTASGGDKLTLELKETLPHSGIFSGSTQPNYRPKDVAPDPADDKLAVDFGEEVTVVYEDGKHSAGTEPAQRAAAIKVFLGSDGIVNTFSKRFVDEDIAVKTAFTIAEAYFELAKDHRELEKNELADEEINIGKRLLEEAMAAFPNTKYAAQADYLLANLAQETENFDEAIGRYEQILQHWPDSEYAPKAQYKLGLCHEKLGEWDAAVDEYVKITYKYPEHPLVSDVIIRMGQYFWRTGEFRVAGDVFKSFQQRFEEHALAPKSMLLAGQSYIKAKDHKLAIEVLDELVEKYTDDKATRAEAMYWLADSYVNARDLKNAYVVFKKLTWDYPETQWAKMARGRLVEDMFRGMDERL